MRLLHFDDEGELCLTRDLREDKIPPYAILSHVWGDDEDEISFTDVLEGPDKRTSGYAKIRSCGEQARRDNLHYFWVDTCCIDKRSSAELSEAINSMFRWYRKAVVCYAYLYDAQHSQDRPPAFRESVWFTRGWTLQELLAPYSLIFFDSQWRNIGDGAALAGEIETVTTIPARIFDTSGNDSMWMRLREFSVARRMSWAATRRTSRVEDTAYCLMGIFDINMPLLYGEGAKAFRRLQEEIIKISNDETILAWNYPFGKGLRIPDVLAPHPSCFAARGDVVRVSNPRALSPKDHLFEVRAPYMTTHKGLQINTRLFSMPNRFGSRAKMMLLNCQTFNGPLALILSKSGQGYVVRGCVELNSDAVRKLEASPSETIYLFDHYPLKHEDVICRTLVLTEDNP